MPHYNRERILSPGFTIDKNIKSHANDPFVVEKGRRSQETLKRVGFPKEYLKIRAEQLLKATK